MVTQSTLEGDNIRYGKIFNSSNKERLKRYKEILFEKGIKKVIFTSAPRSKDSLNFSELTLLILPNITDLGKNINAQPVSININNSRFVVQPNYNNIEGVECQSILINDDNNQPRTVIDYYKDRNIIILYYNPFPFVPRTKQFENNIIFITRNLVLTTNNINNNQIIIPSVPVTRLSPEELKKQNMKINIEMFMNNIKKSYIDLQKDVEQIKKDIILHETTLISKYNNLLVKEELMLASKNMDESFEKGFETKINEIKALPFIKDVEILRTGIKLDYGEIFIEDVYIGKLFCLITPTEIKIFNMDNPRDRCAHPHVYDGGRPCFGNTSGKVAELLGKLELKQLSYLIGQFMHTYTAKGSPAKELKYWKKENK